MDCSLPGSSVHGIFRATVLEWGAIAFSIEQNIYLHLFLFIPMVRLSGGMNHFICDSEYHPDHLAIKGRASMWVAAVLRRRLKDEALTGHGVLSPSPS